MNQEKAQRIRAEITKNLFDVNRFPASPFLRKDWKGLIFDNYRYRDNYSGHVRDDDFSLISELTRKEFQDTRIFLVTLDQWDKLDKESGSAVCAIREGRNTRSGYSEFKCDTGLFEFYLFGRSLQWLIYANSDWWILGANRDFIDTVIVKFGGWSKVYARFKEEVGVHEENEPMEPHHKEWREFVLNVWRQQDVQ